MKIKRTRKRQKKGGFPKKERYIAQLGKYSTTEPFKKSYFFMMVEKAFNEVPF